MKDIEENDECVAVAFDAAWEQMKDLSNEQRKHVLYELKQAMCFGCGKKYGPLDFVCQCENDE